MVVTVALAVGMEVTAKDFCGELCCRLTILHVTSHLVWLVFFCLNIQIANRYTKKCNLIVIELLWSCLADKILGTFETFLVKLHYFAIKAERFAGKFQIHS